MEAMPVEMSKRPFLPIMFLVTAFGVMIVSLAVGIYLMAGPQIGQVVWVLVRVAWRILPAWVWVVASGTAVFWLWLIRQLWRKLPASESEEHALPQESAAFFI